MKKFKLLLTVLILVAVLGCTMDAGSGIHIPGCPFACCEDIIAPVIISHSMSGGVDGVAKAGDAIILTVIASDDRSGIATENAYAAAIKIGSVAISSGAWRSNVFTYIIKAGKTGKIIYSVSVTDIAGNKSVIEDIVSTITVDALLPADAPVVDDAATLAVNGTFKSADNKYFYSGNSGINFKFTPRADIKGYTVESNPSPGQIKNSIILTDGTHTVYTVYTVYAVDTADMIGTGLELVVTSDTIRPIVTHNMIGGTGGVAKTDDIITLTVNATDDGGSGIPTTDTYTATIKIGTDPVVNNITQSNNEFKYTVKSGDTGLVTYTVSAKDNVGNKSDSAGNTDIVSAITVYTSQPSDAPVVDDATTLAVSGTFKSADNKYFYSGSSGINFKFISRDGIKGYTVESNPSSEQITNSITLTDGTYTVYAVDTADILGTGLELVVASDTTRPIVTHNIIGGTGGAATIDDIITLTVNATDDGGSGIPTTDTYTATIKIGTDTVVNNITQSNSEFKYTVKSGDTGKITYTVSAKDNVGNESDSAGNTDIVSTITVDTPPEPSREMVFTHNGTEYQISLELYGKYSWGNVDAALTKYNADATGGFNDWFWPDKDLLNAAYTELYAEGKPLHDLLLANYLWSSTSNDNSSAWIQRFSNGGKTTSGKSSSENVRFVRVFP